MTANGSIAGVAESHGKSMPWRWDIQILRGWAIVLVIIDHADAPVFKGGFLGVDIFFVISGFLMTGLIIQALDSQQFTFSGFFARRVRRLFPAAYATLIGTALLAPFLLDPFELMNFTSQLFGAFTFVVNIVLWQQVDYFNSAAALKPLLHMWSLSVEEQYYIVLPIILFFCPRKLRIPLCLILVVGSLVACLYAVQKSPSAAFYFLPFRAWEMGFGSLAALLLSKRKFDFSGNVVVALRLLSALALIIIPWFFDERGHPGVAAIIVCVATTVLVATGSASAKAGPLYPFAWIGDRSYSLYLIHWPLFAFANNIFIEKPDAVTRTLLVVLCFALAELQYRFVENRFRKMSLTIANLRILLAIPVLSVSLAMGWSYLGDHSDTAFRSENAGLSVKCPYKGVFTAIPECQTSAEPKTMVWGDSFAMAITPGLAATAKDGLIQATRPVCGPFLGIAPVNGTQYKEAWAQNCIAFNQSVFDYLKSHPEIKTVVLSSAMAQYLPGAEGDDWRLVHQTNGSVSETALSNNAVINSLKATVDSLRSIGRVAVFVAPPPSTGFDIGRCLQRLAGNYPTVFPVDMCNFERNAYQAARSEILSFLSLVHQQNIVPIISLDDTICEGNECETNQAGVSLYRDQAHLSIPGSIYLAKTMNLMASVNRIAE